MRATLTIMLMMTLMNGVLFLLIDRLKVIINTHTQLYTVYGLWTTALTDCIFMYF